MFLTQVLKQNFFCVSHCLAFSTTNWPTIRLWTCSVDIKSAATFFVQQNCLVTFAPQRNCFQTSENVFTLRLSLSPRTPLLSLSLSPPTLSLSLCPLLFLLSGGADLYLISLLFSTICRYFPITWQNRKMNIIFCDLVLPCLFSEKRQAIGSSYTT